MRGRKFYRGRVYENKLLSSVGLRSKTIVCIYCLQCVRGQLETFLGIIE
jgi:hypothetical protein